MGNINLVRDLGFASVYYSIYISLIDLAYAYRNNYKLSNHTWTALNVTVLAWINLHKSFVCTNMLEIIDADLSTHGPH